MPLRSRAILQRCLLCVSAVLLAVVGAAPWPASAASASNTYTALWSGGGTTTTVLAGALSTVTVVLANTSTGPQSFGSAQIKMGNIPVAGLGPVSDSQSATTGWSEAVVSTNPYKVQVSSPKGSAGVPPGDALSATFTVEPPSTGSFSIDTQVKQSNDFNGPNNQFTWTNAPLTLTVVQQCNTGTSGSCSSTTQSDSIGATGSVTFTTSTNNTTLQFAAGFTGNDLSCDSSVIGNHTNLADEFKVDLSTQATVGKTITLTLPKKVVDAMPNNGTNQMPVCLASNYPFPTYEPTLTASSDYEGLVYDCTDPAYQTILTDDYTSNNGGGPQPGSPYQTFPCVQSRSKSGLQGGETVVVYFPTDPYDWAGAW